jgi:hypothetical protein
MAKKFIHHYLSYLSDLFNGKEALSVEREGLAGGLLPGHLILLVLRLS